MESNYLQKINSIASFDEWIQKSNFKDNCDLTDHILQNFLHNQGKKPIWDDETKRLYKIMTLYFSRNPQFETLYFSTTKGNIPYKLNKGLLIIGTCGRSKSFSFKVFNKFNALTKSPHKYKTFDSMSIESHFTERGLKALNDYANKSTYEISNTGEIYYNMYIDELGAEAISVKNYGNKVAPLESLLERLHRIFTENKKVTHITTNLELDELKTNYGDRIYSRMFEMFNIIRTGGADLRLELI